jgi:integrase
VLKNNGLPKMRYHDLRHSTAGILHDKNWDLKDIQEWLRHADREVTGNIYTHISEQRKMANAKNLENTFII